MQLVNRKAVQVWLRPELSAAALKSYIPKTAQERITYTLEDHTYLLPGSPMRSLLETFREAVLELDPCVTEQVLKLYVAFKGETNFVDVIPQKSRLRLVAW